MLNIGLDLQVISPTVFAMPVLMALFTTVAPPLFEAGHKLRTLSQAMDEVQQKFGVNSVRFAGMRGSRAQIPNRIAFTHVPEIAEDERRD